MNVNLPEWLSEWHDAETILSTTDVPALRRSLDTLFELVGEDGDGFDALEGEAEAALAGVIGTLYDAREHGSDLEIFVAGRLTKNVLAPYARRLPAPWKRVYDELPN